MIDIHSSEGVCTITLNWPETRNALGPLEVVELAEAITREGSAPGLRFLIITGDRTFCSGGDLGAITSFIEGLTPAQITDMVYSKFQSLLSALLACPVPTIAAVDGAAIGLGMDLALACDMRFVGPHGYLAQGWGRAGLVTGTGGVAFLEALAPGATWELLATNAKIDAETAERMGIATAAPGGAGDAARDRAAALTGLPPAAAASYAVLQRSLRWPSAEFLAECARHQGELLASDEFAAFAQSVLGGSR